MTLIQVDQAIAYARYDQNLFIVSLTIPDKVMQATGCGRSTHLVTKHKKIKIWHQRFRHASNTRTVRALKPLTGMRNFNNAYNPIKIYSNLKQSNSKYKSNHDNDHLQVPVLAKMLLLAISTNNNFDSICTSCIASKQTLVIIQNQPMKKANEKLNKIHIDLWGPDDPPFLSKKTYAGIQLNAKTQKSWVLYLRSKDKFVDVFQVWLPVVENQCNKSMKVFCANKKEEFISIKLKDFCNKKGIIINYAALYMPEENCLAEWRWKTIMTMKNSLLINSGSLLEF